MMCQRAKESDGRVSERQRVRRCGNLDSQSPSISSQVEEGELDITRGTSRGALWRESQAEMTGAC